MGTGRRVTRPSACTAPVRNCTASADTAATSTAGKRSRPAPLLGSPARPGFETQYNARARAAHPEGLTGV